MPKKVVWTARAKKSYLRITDFIAEKWTSKEVEKFAKTTSSTLLKIKQAPEMFVVSKQIKNLRKGFITKHTSLLYRIKSSEIELLFFWDNRQNPKKLKF